MPSSSAGEILTRGPAQVGSLQVQGYRYRVKKLRLQAPDDATEQDTGFDLPSKAFVLDVFLDVTTAESTGTTKTVDVGLLSTETNGDADGFLVGADVSATGLVRGTLASGGQTLGALLRVDEDGAGALVPEPHTVNTAVSVSWTAGSADFAELDAGLYVVYADVA